jgi:hypothetical protein
MLTVEDRAVGIPEMKNLFFIGKNSILLFLSEYLLNASTLKQNIAGFHRIYLACGRIA